MDCLRKSKIVIYNNSHCRKFPYNKTNLNILKIEYNSTQMERGNPQKPKGLRDEFDRELSFVRRLYPKTPQKSSLSMTAEDHEARGSTPPEELRNNPGENGAELMTDAEIIAFLKQQKELIEECLSPQIRSTRGRLAADLYFHTKRDLRANIKYLQQIGRLPKKFRI